VTKFTKNHPTKVQHSTMTVKKMRCR